MQVFLTRRNVDTTEGRGPMVNVSAVPEEEESIKKRTLAKLSAIERRVLGLS